MTAHWTKKTPPKARALWAGLRIQHMQNYSISRSLRNHQPRPLDAELVVTSLAVRAILRRVKVSPAVAYVIAALAGLNVEAR
jgi:hypothetical protein